MDLFPIFDPISCKFLDYKNRRDVHRDGDWHKGIQAHIVRPNEQGSFDILLQKRSGSVDICKYRYDQSLATQMTKADDLNEYLALSRGLASELAVKPSKVERLDLEVRIIKTYPDEEDVLNREIISLYLVTSQTDNITPIPPKVIEARWLSWEDFVNLFHINRAGFTKTAQFYLGYKRMVKYIEYKTREFLGLKPLWTQEVLPELFFRVDIHGLPQKTYGATKTNLIHLIQKYRCQNYPF